MQTIAPSHKNNAPKRKRRSHNRLHLKISNISTTFAKKDRKIRKMVAAALEGAGRGGAGVRRGRGALASVPRVAAPAAREMRDL